MGKRDVRVAGDFRSGPLVIRRFRNQSHSIGSKRLVLSVVLTVKLSEGSKNFYCRNRLRDRGTIEWE